MGGRGLGASGLGLGPLAGCCEHGNEPVLIWMIGGSSRRTLLLHGVRSLPLDLRLQCCDEWLYKTLCVSATFHRVPVYPSHSLTLFVCCKALLMHYHSWSATRSPLQTVWRGGLPCWVHANRSSNVAVAVNVSRLANCAWRELCPTVT